MLSRSVVSAILIALICATTAAARALSSTPPVLEMAQGAIDPTTGVQWTRYTVFRRADGRVLVGALCGELKATDGGVASRGCDTDPPVLVPAGGALETALIGVAANRLETLRDEFHWR